MIPPNDSGASNRGASNRGASNRAASDPGAHDSGPDPAELEALDDGTLEDTGEDEVIGVAFRRSLVVFAAVGLVVLLIVFVLRRDEGPGEEVLLETTAPVAVDETVVAPAVPFADVTAEWGVDFVHQSGAEGEKLLPETMGSGVALFDADGDGDVDLLFADGTRWSHGSERSPGSTRLYRNDLATGGGFVDVTDAAGLRTPELYGTGVTVGDIDADGDLDLFLASIAGDRLYRNDSTAGTPRFVDVTDAAGVAGAEDSWSTSAAFVDVDRDGDLDLFVANYVVWSRQIDAEVDYRLTGVGRAYGPPVNYRGTFPSLFRNEGDGTFVDVSEAAGLHVRNPATDVPVGKGLGVAPVDLDEDGAIDLVVANDTVRNFLFHNRGDGTFEEIGEPSGLAYGRSGEATGAMGIDFGHYRNDGDIGFAIGNFANEMTSLYMSRGAATLFVDEAIVDGVGAPSRTLLTFGVLMLDVDLDGRLDLLQTNGHLENEIAKVDPSQSFEQRSQLFWNAGPNARSTFVEVPPEQSGALAQPIVGRASATADLDGDGDLDVVVTQAGRAALVLRNDQATGHHWLRVRLDDSASANRFGVGAVVTVRAGGVVQERQVTASRSYQSASELVLTFGLGTATAIEVLEVLWPDGTTQSVDPASITLDTEVTVERG